jgi:hypothetical protein
MNEFERAARRYCDVIERHPKLDRTDFLGELLTILSQAYALGRQLPLPETKTEELPPTQMTQEDWGELFSQLHRYLGDADTYWRVLDPYEEGEAIACSLADDLADIYRDLKEGLLLIETGTERDEVIWQWRFGFDTHWGAHALEALRAIHRFYF